MPGLVRVNDVIENQFENTDVRAQVREEFEVRDPTAHSMVVKTDGTIVASRIVEIVGVSMRKVSVSLSMLLVTTAKSEVISHVFVDHAAHRVDLAMYNVNRNARLHQAGAGRMLGQMKHVHSLQGLYRIIYLLVLTAFVKRC